MPKSKHRKKHTAKKKSKNREILEKRKNLKHHLAQYERIMKLVDEENRKRRKANIETVSNWNETDETITPSHQMLNV